MHNLNSNNYIRDIFAFVKKGDEMFYTYSDKEYWIGEWWDSQISLQAEEVLEEKYFDFIKEFKVDFDIIKQEYDNIKEEYQLQGNLPKVYVDFEKKIFYSTFFDQELENRVAEGWIGKYVKFLDYIPHKFRYWIDNGS